VGRGDWEGIGITGKKIEGGRGVGKRMSTEV